MQKVFYAQKKVTHLQSSAFSSSRISPLASCQVDEADFADLLSKGNVVSQNCNAL